MNIRDGLIILDRWFDYLGKFILDLRKKLFDLVYTFSIIKFQNS